MGKRIDGVSAVQVEMAHFDVTWFLKINSVQDMVKRYALLSELI